MRREKTASLLYERLPGRAANMNREQASPTEEREEDSMALVPWWLEQTSRGERAYDIYSVCCATHHLLGTPLRPLLLKNALGEILANCAKAVSGRRELESLFPSRFSERRHRQGPYLCRDNGPGVPTISRPRFSRTSSTIWQNPGQAWGLGLARRVVRAHRGWLSKPVSGGRCGVHH